MYDWALALSILLSVGLTAYLATVFLGNLLRRGNQGTFGTELTVLKRKIESVRVSMQQSFSLTQMMLAVNQLVRLVYTVFDIVPLTLSIVSMVFVHRKIYVFGVGMFLVGTFLMSNTEMALGAVEQVYQCVLSPFLNNYLFSFMHLMNLLFGALMPVVNLFIILLRQVLVGSALVLTKCQTSTLTVVNFITALVQVFKRSVAEVLRFYGFTNGGINGQNNFVVNTMRWERIVEPVRELFQFLPESLSCLCAGNSGFLKYFWKFLTYPLFTDELDMMVSNGLNFFVSWLQVLLQTLPPFLSYPNFQKPFFHLVALTVETGRLMDKWTIELFQLVTKLFKIGGFNVIVEVPELFVFGTLARLVSFLIVVFEKLVDMLQHLILPFDERPITDTVFMQEVFSMKKPFAYFDAFLVSMFSSLHFMTSTLIKVFVLVSAMGSETGCLKFPKSCHFYNNGACAVYCQSRTTIVFRQTPLRCPFEVNARARFEFNLDAIETLDRKVFAALDSYDGGFVTLQSTRSCVPEWDSTFTYRHKDIVAYNDRAYFCKSSRCFFTSLQQQYPDSTCGSLVTCWEEILYGADALQKCPTVLNQTESMSFDGCQEWCNQTEACRAFEHFDRDKYKSERETISRQCGSTMKCDFPQCTLFREGFENVNLYLRTERSPTVLSKSQLQLAFLYGEEGVLIRNNTYLAFCELDSDEDSIYCSPLVKGIALERVEQFEAYGGKKDRYYTFAYKSDLFTTEQEVFLPLQREILSVSVQKSILNKFTFEFSRRNPRNQSELLADPLQGEEVNATDFQSGIVRKTYKNLIAPDDMFSVDTFLSCTGLSFARVPTNTILIFYEFLNEMLWKLIIGGSIRAAELSGDPQNLFVMRLFDLLYKYDGGWYSRDEEPPCHAPLPTSAERLTLEDYQGTSPFDPYCNDAPTLQMHVYANWDKMAFFFTSVFQRDTFGKLVFNVLRFFPEAYRVFGRMVLDLQSTRFVRRLALLPLGCGFSYGPNKTGDCTPILSFNTMKPPCPIGFPSEDCSCRVEDPILDYDTTCACIWLPSATLDEDLRQTTSIAVSHWCGVNMMEWTLIYFSRITDAIKLILDSMQSGSTSFPVTPDLCKIDETNEFQRGGKSYALVDSLINRVFGGVVVRNFLTDEVSRCEITAEHDFACSIASIFERTVKLLLGMVRKLWRNSVAVVSFQPDVADVDLSMEICGLEKTQAAIASSIVEISPGLSKESLATRKGITSLIYSFIDIIGVVFSEVHVGMLFVRSFLSGNPDIIDGGAMGTDSAQNAVSSSDTTTIFYAAMTKFVVVWTTFFKQVFESLAKIGSRDLFLQIRDIVSLIEQLITGGIIPIVAQMAYLAIRILGLMFTPHLITGETVVEIITEVLDLLGQFVNILLSQAMRVLGLILQMMGTFGQLIGSLLKLICGIQATLSTLTMGAWKRMDCSALPTFGRRLAEKDVTLQAFEAFEWNGDNFCDHFMHAYKDWDGGFQSMRPIEQLRFQECLEWRIMNEHLINVTGLKALPHDFLYNWKQPPILFAKGMQAGFLYAQWWLTDGRNVASLKQMLDQTGLPATDILETVTHVKRMFQNTVTRANAHTLMMNVFRENDPAFLDPNSTSSTSQAYRVYDAVSTSVFGLYDIVFSEEFARNLKGLHKFKLPAYEAENIRVRVPTTGDIFSKKALQFGHQVASAQQSFGRVYSSLECQQTDADRLFCFECALVDNFLYTSLETTRELGDFYDNQFKTDFLDLFNASWTDKNEYNQKYYRAFQAAQTRNEERYGGTEALEGSSISEWLAYASGLVLYGNRSVEEFGLAISYWVQGNYTGQVPANATLLFPNDFQTLVELPFQADCTSASFLWHEKIRSPFYGFVPAIVAFSGLELYLFLVSDLPFVVKTMAYLGLSVGSFVAYLMVVYGMNPFCLPQLPPYLLRDLLLWLEETLFVSCSCTWFPFLSKECTQQTCYSCTSEVSPSYYSCMDNASGMKELGMWWHPAFFARWQFTEAVAWVDSLNIFPFTFLRDVEGLSVLLKQASDNEAVKGLDLDCFWLGILLPISQSILLFAAFMTFSPLITWVLTVTQECILFVFHVVLSTVYLAYAASSS